MTTASILLKVSTKWGGASDKCEELVERGRDVAAVAAEELRETSATKEQALRLMRDWISQNPDIADVRKDDSFLLRFLRHKKYSIPMAQQTLLKYLNLRQFYPESFAKLDCEDPKMQEILNTGYLVVSPIRDSKGRRVLVYNMGNFNPSKFTCWDLCRVHNIVYESLLEDSVDQVCGFTHIGDGGGTTVAHITFWNPVDFGRLIKWGEQSLPMRHKECHLFNVSSTIKYGIDFAVSKVTPKMAERLHIHTDLPHLQKHVDVACLPSEYGGKISTSDMVCYTKRILSEQRHKLLALDSMHILSTQGIHSSRSKGNAQQKDNGESLQGSFRKLEID